MGQETIISELQRIADNHGGLLRPVDVVEAARPKSSPLHSRFTWDDTKAAAEYRLWQAQSLIRVTVEYLKVGGEETKHRVFVSLTPDRALSGGGYRVMNVVLGHAQMRAQLLKDAFEEMERFKQKYAALEELVEVFSAMRSVRKSKRKIA